METQTVLSGYEQAEILQKAVDSLNVTAALRYLAEKFAGQITFSTSFSFEDQIITHEILAHEIGIEIFTLDTGRLFAETYSVWSKTNDYYNAKIKAYYPQAADLEAFINQKGINAFYESVENRKSCCHIRKVEPLQRALKGKKLWVTGLRADHSPERSNSQSVEWDEKNQLIKFHPLLHWKTEECWEYINMNRIPYNPLHQKGFVSIGCSPCTRAIQIGEDFRAGRWWWEDQSKKECGLHTK